MEIGSIIYKNFSSLRCDDDSSLFSLTLYKVQLIEISKHKTIKASRLRITLMFQNSFPSYKEPVKCNYVSKWSPKKVRVAITGAISRK